MNKQEKQKLIDILEKTKKNLDPKDPESQISAWHMGYNDGVYGAIQIIERFEDIE